MIRDTQLSFKSFVLSKPLRFELVSTALLFAATYVLLLWIYPFPNTYADTGAYITVAGNGLIGNYRPPGYSWFMALAHLLNPDPDILVLFQTILYFFSTLFFYLTARYFFNQGSDRLWRIFFVLFMLAPTCIYLCNFVISDSIFISLTNLWLASLLWIMGTQKRMAIFFNAILLLLLMQVRYIALFYPLVTVIGLFFTYYKKQKLQLLLNSLIQVAVFAGVIIFTTQQTKKNIGVATFSGFSGWQKANNALHIMPYINLKPEQISDPEVRSVHAFILANNPRELYPAKDSVVVSYLWSPYGPLKKYMFHLKGKGQKAYLHYWHLASIPIGKWADYIVKKYPGHFAQHYLKPNFLLLFKMSNEALFIFPPPSQQMKDWFACNNCDTSPNYSFYHDFLAKTASPSFTILWVLLGLSFIALCFKSKLSTTSQQYNMLIVVSFFCVTYTAMSVYASPIVLRYLLVIRHAAVLLPFLILIYFLSGHNGRAREESRSDRGRPGRADRSLPVE